MKSVVGRKNFEFCVGRDRRCNINVVFVTGSPDHVFWYWYSPGDVSAAACARLRLQAGGGQQQTQGKEPGVAPNMIIIHYTVGWDDFKKPRLGHLCSNVH